MPFLMIRNDITKVAADAIVNPANRNLLQGSGTSRAIYQAAGEQELTASCEAIGRCDLGTAGAAALQKVPVGRVDNGIRRHFGDVVADHQKRLGGSSLTWFSSSYHIRWGGARGALVSCPRSYYNRYRKKVSFLHDIWIL